MASSECPECGGQFHGYKCGCGYKLPYKAGTDKNGEPAPESSMCLAHGCPNAGTISENTRPPHNWLCRHHWHEDPKKWQEITRRMRGEPVINEEE